MNPNLQQRLVAYLKEQGASDVGFSMPPDAEAEFPGLPYAVSIVVRLSDFIIDEIDGVPLHLKLKAWQGGRCHFLVADGVEQEPYSSSAWAVRFNLLYRSKYFFAFSWGVMVGSKGMEISWLV